MKYYILLFFISFEIYKNQICEKIKSCYNCTTSNNNCTWFNSCYSSNSDFLLTNNSKNFKNPISSYPFLTNQYICIINKNDIETFKELDNETITLSITSNTLQRVDTPDKIDYHIYCLEYDMISNILLSFQYNKNYSKNIIQLSLYDNITNLDRKISINNGKNRINIQSNYACIKITYKINGIIEDIMSFHVLKLKKDNDIKNKNENFISYIILISSILFIIIIIWIFIICYKNKTGIMKEITIINNVKIADMKNNNNDNENNTDDNHSDNDSNCNKSNCSELQEKYLQLEQKSFVANNYETLYSFVHSLHDIEKKDACLKTIIKTLPSFILGIEDGDLIGTICFFCENKIKLNEKVCLLNCGHIFHYGCISQQIITNEEYNCIICKENIII